MTWCVALENSLRICVDKVIRIEKVTTQRVHIGEEKRTRW